MQDLYSNGRRSVRVVLNHSGRASRTLTVLLAAGLLLAADRSSLHAQQLTGWFHVLYVDPPRGQRPPSPLYGLVDSQGRWTPLVIDDATLRAAGGPRALDRRMVTVVGDPVPGAAPSPGAARLAPAQRVRTLRSLQPTAAAAASNAGVSAALGVKKYVMLLCRFSDQAGQPLPRGWYDAVVGPARPNLAHYYDEMSYGRLSLAGSVAVGWFTLPKPYGYYYPGSGSGNNAPVFDALLNDCVAAADASVDFTQYAGIIVQHDVGPDWAFGGSWTLTVDGQTRTYGVAWMPKSGPAQLAHEVGHTLGLPHSSGGYDQVYDSRWDVMSWPYAKWDPSLDPPDWVPQHTIMYNKWWLGWIDGTDQLLPSLPSTQAVMLLRSARPPTAAGYRLIRVNDPAAPGTFVTAEARRLAGYDQGVPGDAIVLHSYDPARPEPARVIDVDRNSDPNDAGAMWTVGESYADSVLGLTIDVDSIDPSGFGVTVVRGWRLRMHATGPGRISGAPSGACTAQCDHIAAARGSSIALTAQPNVGAQFVGWTGACSGTGTCAVTLAGNRFVGATFAMPVALTSASDRPRALVARPYADTLRATGGAAPINWSVTGGALPPGLALASSTGVISGQPTAAGRFAFTVTATSGTLRDARDFTMSVVVPVTITSAPTRRSGVMGAAYADTVRASGGNDAFDWRVVGGALPAGLTLEPAGVLRGTPAMGGTFRFMTSASSDGLSDQREFEVVIAKPTLAAAAVLDLLLAGSSALTADERSFLDLLGNHNGRVDLGDVRAWLVDSGALRSDAAPGESIAALTRVRGQQSAPARRATTATPAADLRRGTRP